MLLPVRTRPGVAELPRRVVVARRLLVVVRLTHVVRGARVQEHFREIHLDDLVVLGGVTGAEAEVALDSRHLPAGPAPGDLEDPDETGCSDQPARQVDARVVHPVGQVGDALGYHLCAGGELATGVVDERLAGELV